VTLSAFPHVSTPKQPTPQIGDMGTSHKTVDPFIGKHDMYIYINKCCQSHSMLTNDHMTPLYPQKLALSSLTSGGHSVGVVCSWTKAMELVSHSPFACDMNLVPMLGPTLLTSINSWSFKCPVLQMIPH
jgi:hypothetical protein